MSISANSWRIFLISVACKILFAATALSASPWDWKAEPSAENWKTFMKLKEGAQTKAWADLKTKGLNFEDLSWQWRLGWIKACAQSRASSCADVLQLGLFDRAMVVRAESAAAMGDRFAGTAHSKAIRLLRTAYSVQQNQRAARPLFVQYRILHALKQIGGEGVSVGESLALRSQDTKHYWARLEKQTQSSLN